jgi:hypothetical protein
MEVTDRFSRHTRRYKSCCRKRGSRRDRHRGRIYRYVTSRMPMVSVSVGVSVRVIIRAILTVYWGREREI